MQITPRYLVNNRIEIIANEAGFITEYKPVYQRHIQVYKGIDNILQFRLLNADQKPLDASLYTPVFVAYDNENNKILDKECVVLDDGSTRGRRGLFQVTITKSNMLNINQQYLSYAIYLLDSEHREVITYTNSHFGNNGVIYVSTDAFPEVKPSREISTFLKVGAFEEQDQFWISEVSYANPEENDNEGLHTVAIYTSEYTGSIVIQGTLENQVTGTTKWADLISVDLDNESEPVSVNFFGIFSYIRFKLSADPTDRVEKILLRN